MSATAIGSMPVNGSSSSRNDGSVAIARAISTRRRSPPKAVAARVDQFRKTELFEQNRQAAILFGPGDAVHLPNEPDVVSDRELAEDRVLLCEVPDSRAGADVHRRVGQIDVLSVTQQRDAAAVGLDQSDGHVERRRLAGAVGTEQSDDLAGFDRRRDVVDDLALAVALA